MGGLLTMSWLASWTFTGCWAGTGAVCGTTAGAGLTNTDVEPTLTGFTGNPVPGDSCRCRSSLYRLFSPCRSWVPPGLGARKYSGPA